MVLIDSARDPPVREQSLDRGSHRHVGVLCPVGLEVFLMIHSSAALSAFLPACRGWRPLLASLTCHPLWVETCSSFRADKFQLLLLLLLISSASLLSGPFQRSTASSPCPSPPLGQHRTFSKRSLVNQLWRPRIGSFVNQITSRKREPPWTEISRGSTRRAGRPRTGRSSRVLSDDWRVRG